MAQPDVFALKNSDLNAFLFAEVGTELNGSSLTVLSILARLGEDPWAEAARWARLPKAEIVDRLVRSMAQMPLCPQALRDAPATAARLVKLLPSFPQPSLSSASIAVRKAEIPRWLPVVVFGGMLVCGLVFNLVMMSK